MKPLNIFIAIIFPISLVMFSFLFLTNIGFLAAGVMAGYKILILFIACLAIFQVVLLVIIFRTKDISKKMPLIIIFSFLVFINMAIVIYYARTLNPNLYS